MNRFKKYCPNVFVAETDTEYQKGDIITIETKYGKEVECQRVNHLFSKDGKHYYSIIRLDGMNSQGYAEKRAERLDNQAANAQKRADGYYEASQEGKDFLSLAEPIKIGHHSEKRHRALIERNQNRMRNFIKELDKVKTVAARSDYWERKAQEIKLDMPESLDFFTAQLQTAKEYHQGLKDGSIERLHSYSLVYANKAVKEIAKKVEIAKKLWGEQ